MLVILGRLLKKLLNRLLFINHGYFSLLQSEDDGRWHNILDDPNSFLETSSTAMILTAYIRGLSNGWLDENAYLNHIYK